MPKPKPKKAEPRFSAHSFQLPDEVRNKLRGLVGGENDKAIQDAEKALGLGLYGAVHLDDIPRPADYVAAFKPIKKDAIKLFNSLCQLGGYFSEQFVKNGADQDAIEAALLSLNGVAGAVIKDFEALPSKGAPKNNALAEVTRRLRRAFRENFRGAKNERKKKGAFQFRSENEKLEIEFVETALLSARLIPKAKSTSRVQRLFLDPRCAMPSERDATIERIANKVHSSRQQKGDQ